MGLLLESTFVAVLCAILLIFLVFYFSVTQKYSYWRDKGVPHVTPKFPFGSMKDVFMGKIHIGELYNQYYKQFKGERYFGSFIMKKPDLVLRDPDLIKHILTKDFHHFSDRMDMNIIKKADYIHLHLFNMTTAQEWKKMRMKLTPTFTSGKMKAMFYLMTKCCEQLNEYVDKKIQCSSVLDVKDTLARFTMDIIATCAFGLEINSLSDKDCEFYRIAGKVFVPTKFEITKEIIMKLLPVLSKIIPLTLGNSEISDFFTKIVRDTVKYRDKNHVVRNDFLDLLIKIRQNKTLIDEDKKQNNNVEVEQRIENDEKFTIEMMTAQSFVFFAAGFETASSTMTFCLYELACNPKIQEKIHQEIKEVLEKNEGKPTYQALQQMTYMDQVVNETLRRYASVPNLNRTCVEPYKVPDSDLVLEKGQIITIPTYAIHHDPEFYPEPYKFDPERFSADKVRERHQYVHLPFGEGPRMCIGMRFGLMQTKMGLTEMLSNFEFGLLPETQIPITINKRSIVTQPEKPILLSITKRN